MANFVNEYVALNTSIASSFGWDQSYSDGGNVEKYSDSPSYSESYDAYNDGR